MTKEEILQEFSDINEAYNNCTKYDTLERMLDELMTNEEQALLQKWRDNRGISMKDFEEAMNALQKPLRKERIMG